ncbi:carbohydrate-binding protein [Formosa sp. PL04]|uniref:carbohydrate-binding protein n=1 Tax=Formosa sp. PL04 TaxID=3081755 RepID=UPI00298238E3|nr:carbohydrate-binding protein [Formosa sp. PL04]MDW5288132.1 carbohydrate-binding protein [Formosa sp. PL04]
MSKLNFKALRVLLCTKTRGNPFLFISSLRTLCVTGFLLPTLCFSQSYPFDLPNTVTATLNVETNLQEAFRNPLLGYNIFGFNSSTDKDFINTFNPNTIRFPHGLFANWYDWRQDKSRVFGTETFDYIFRKQETRTTEIDELHAINIFDTNNMKVGIDGLAQLNSDKKAANQGQGYNVVWTFNMSADGTNFNNGSPETVARYDDLIARGFEVKDIELGNECFYPGQRSSIIPNATEYIARAKSMSQALKARDPNIQVSIPLLRRGSWVNPDWNDDVTQDLTYFDAVTVHTYIGSDPDNAANTDDAFSTALTARKSLETSTDAFVRIYTGNKPIWLTEWGVKSGGPNAVSALGMADCYLFMSENQNIYQRANWFSVNGKLNSFVTFEDYVVNGNTRSRIKYPLEKTVYGATHEILRSVFENSMLLESSMNTTILEDDVKAVSARVVTKNGKTTVFVINLTNKSVPFTLKMDGTTYNGAFMHKAMQFDNVAQERNLPINEDPQTLIKDGSGAITLPPLSINTIALNGSIINNPVTSIPGILEVENYNYGGQGVGYSDSDSQDKLGAGRPGDGVDIGLDNGGKFIGYTAAGEWLKYTINVQQAGDYDFKFVYASGKSGGGTIGAKINESVIFTGHNLPQTAGWGDFQTDTSLNSVTLAQGFQTLLVNIEGTSFNLDKINIVSASNQNPYHGIVNVPGIIEAENYDVGGEGISFHDLTLGNTGGTYRTDDVDVQSNANGYNVGWIDTGEWLEYTINVPDTGAYNFEFTYAANSDTAKIGASFPDENLPLFTNYSLEQTAGWTDYKTATKYGLNLTAGIHVLRFNIDGGGFNLDKIRVFKPYGSKISANKNLLTVTKETLTETKIELIAYPNPSRTGLFNLSTPSVWHVYNVFGVRVLEGEGNEVDLSKFSTGLYFLKSKHTTKKLIFK